MAKITDPQVITFCNEVIRPICERLHRVDLLMEAAHEEWMDKIKSLTTSNDNADLIDDRRDAEGVSRLTLADLKAVVNVFKMLSDKIGEDNKTRKRLRKPTVRRLQFD